jgi:nucleotidyltransferase substrate binding protein (TIGR01987 family)
MTAERFAERKADLARAVSRLDEALAEPPSDVVRDATIQRFEFCIELTWRALKAWLERQGNDIGSPRATLRRAFADGLIPNPAEAEAWLRMLDDRNLTSHTYDHELAIAVFERIRTDHAPRLRTMSETIGELDWG